MATETQEAAKAPTNPFTPTVWEDHQADIKARAEARTERRKELRRYLDPDVAKSAEARKPLYEWKVSCEYSRRNAKGRMETHRHTEQVIAQNETDAWAMSCDKLEVMIGPHEGDREIKKLNKIN